MNNKPLVKWHIGGNLLDEAFKILRVSVNFWKKLYGDSFEYLVCYNNTDKRQLAILETFDVELYRQEENDLQLGAPPSGPMWKLAPPRNKLCAHEIILDNDLIMLKKSKKIEEFLEKDHISLTAQSNEFGKVYGRYERLKDLMSEKVNSGLIALPPNLDLASLLKTYVEEANLEDGEICEHGGGKWLHCDIQGLVGIILLENSSLQMIPQADIKIFHPQHELSDLSKIDGVHFIGVNRYLWGHQKHKSWEQFKTKLLV